MTTVFREEMECSVCSAKHEYPFLGSTNTFGGGPDLDLRPAEMYRSTMNMWIQECPECGFISGQVSDKSCVTKQWLQSEQYCTCDGIDFVSDLAKKFYKYYMITIEDNNTEDAFFAALHAAWACDDAFDTENARHCRELAIPLAEILIKNDDPDKEKLMLIKADIMRRAEMFDQMIGEYESVHFNDELMNRILAFEIKKAEEKDADCYRIEDVRFRLKH